MWYDAFCAAVVLVFAWRGAARGAVWQLAVIVSVVLCALFAGQVAPQVEPYLPIDAPLNHWVAVGIVYLGMSFLTFMAARKVRLWLEQIRFVEYDRHWGAILGLLKGVLIAALVTCGLVVLLPRARPVIAPTWSAWATRNALAWATPLLPERVDTALRRAFDPRLEPQSDAGLSLPFPLPQQGLQVFE